MGFFQGPQERVRKSHGKRAISIRATEFLLYMEFDTLKITQRTMEKIIYIKSTPENNKKTEYKLQKTGVKY